MKSIWLISLLLTGLSCAMPRFSEAHACVTERGREEAYQNAGRRLVRKPPADPNRPSKPSPSGSQRNGHGREHVGVPSRVRHSRH